MNVPGQTAPHLASSIDTLYIGILWEEHHRMFSPMKRVCKNAISSTPLFGHEN